MLFKFPKPSQNQLDLESRILTEKRKEQQILLFKKYYAKFRLLILILLITCISFLLFDTFQNSVSIQNLHIIENNKKNKTLPEFFVSAYLPQVPSAASAHSSSLVELNNGKLLAIWFAGSREGAADVALWSSTLNKDGWSPPKLVIDRENLAGSLFSQVRKIGNPLLFVDKVNPQKIHLWFVSVGVGGWAGSSINHTFSDDNGETWYKPTKLQISPFLNISNLVRTPPIQFDNGYIGLPIYHEFIKKFGEFIVLNADGKHIISQKFMPLYNNISAIQPSLIVDDNTIFALLRNSGKIAENNINNYIQKVISKDNGITWNFDNLPHSEVKIRNFSSSIATLKLPSGNWLLVANSDASRNFLNLYLSKDKGKNWQLVKQLENAMEYQKNPLYKKDNVLEHEFSYPSIILGKDNRIHLTYTWNRKTIKYVTFSEQWLSSN